jgi:serine/threonine protein kinase
LLQGLNEHVISVIMRDVASALAYLHKDGIIHRDIKARLRLLL